MTNLKSAAGRCKLTPRGAPYFVPTDKPGTSLGYRRLADSPGTWVARIALGTSGQHRKVRIGTADDREQDNGQDIFSYSRAAEAAKQIGRTAPASSLTVEQALAEYDAAKPSRDSRNVSRVRFHLTPELAARSVAELTVRELQAWQGTIKAAPVTVNRTVRILKAALNQAARTHELTAQPWQNGLRQIAHKHEANNVILSDQQVRDLVAAAYALGEEFGLLVEVLAVTGARISQVVRLQVQDLLPAALHMPTSDKGICTSKNSHEPAPIGPALAARLKARTIGRAPDAPLLTRRQGDAWSAVNQDYRTPFARAVVAAGLDPATVTSYALRHSSIVRRIVLGVPLREIAVLHDTSVVQIERHYSREIARYSTNVTKGVLDIAPPAADNVVALRG